ncbi:putative enoyl-[acyl-carrier-protein] reductase II [Neisseria animaloris]|uniref:NAD(P)H-dependent flavin oxidoreductase n=1 Tax=Neisseria animaloris TaxID=326522 RepID=UPI000A18D3C2|nr:nitronate monooxygenase [Neisseria animaloris]OSI07790.1 2-nitropropane dioxygenase [Neisseria animaloris]VEH88427.1 putative enoyl-[acyl-carrier-protein] reductase II [Neisseria animaloris]
MSPVTKLLGLIRTRLPVIQAPMAGVQSSKLTIAACQAGALGSLPAAMLPSEKLCAEIETIRRHTDRPFNINFFAHRQPEADAVQQVKWLAALAPFYREFGLSEQDVLQRGGRQPFGEEQAEIVMRYRPPVVSFHFGLPEQALLDKVKSSGAKRHHRRRSLLAGSARHRHRYCARFEAGGHRGMFLSRDVNRQQGLFSLLPQIRAAVNVPVVAAGGISDAATARAARALGAASIQIGTALMLADEADTSALHRKALQSERAADTVLTNLFSGGFARGIVNRFIREAGPVSDAAPPFPLAQSASAPLKAAAEAQGSDEFSSLWAGQNAPLAQTGSTREIINSLADAFGSYHCEA